MTLLFPSLINLLVQVHLPMVDEILQDVSLATIKKEDHINAITKPFYYLN